MNDEFINPTFLLFLLLCAKRLEWEHNNSNYKSWRDTWKRKLKTLSLSQLHSYYSYTWHWYFNTPPQWKRGNEEMSWQCECVISLSAILNIDIHWQQWTSDFDWWDSCATIYSNTVDVLPQHYNTEISYKKKSYNSDIRQDSNNNNTIYIA